MQWCRSRDKILNSSYQFVQISLWDPLYRWYHLDFDPSKWNTTRNMHMLSMSWKKEKLWNVTAEQRQKHCKNSIKSQNIFYQKHTKLKIVKACIPTTHAKFYRLCVSGYSLWYLSGGFSVRIWQQVHAWIQEFATMSVVFNGGNILSSKVLETEWRKEFERTDGKWWIFDVRRFHTFSVSGKDSSKKLRLHSASTLHLWQSERKFTETPMTVFRASFVTLSAGLNETYNAVRLFQTILELCSNVLQKYSFLFQKTWRQLDLKSAHHAISPSETNFRASQLQKIFFCIKISRAENYNTCVVPKPRTPMSPCSKQWQTCD